MCLEYFSGIAFLIPCSSRQISICPSLNIKTKLKQFMGSQSVHTSLFDTWRKIPVAYSSIPVKSVCQLIKTYVNLNEAWVKIHACYSVVKVCQSSSAHFLVSVRRCQPCLQPASGLQLWLRAQSRRSHWSHAAHVQKQKKSGMLGEELAREIEMVFSF